MRHGPYPFLLATALLGSPGCGGGLRGNVYYGHDFAFRIATPPRTWRLLDAPPAALAYRDEATETTVLVNGRCGMDGEDVPLPALTQHLFMRFTEQQPELEEVVPFDGREAMHTILVAKLDGVPMEFDAWVLKKDGCVYDFILMAPTDHFKESVADFERFVHGFATVHPLVHGN